MASEQRVICGNPDVQDQNARLRQRVAELEMALWSVLHSVSPCDDPADNPRVELWCCSHNQKRCRISATLERITRLLPATPPEDFVA